MIPSPTTEVAERVAGDDRAMALDPEHQVVPLLSGERLDTDVQSVARRIQARLADPLLEEPDDVWATVARLLRGDAVLLHEVLSGIGQRRVNRHTELLDQTLRVALVPRRGQHDRCLALGRKRLDLARRGDRVEEQQALAVVDCIGGDVPIPRLARLPVRVRRLPVPESSP